MSKRRRRTKRRADPRPRKVTSPRPNLVRQAAESSTPLRLECGPCGASARYDVGTVLVSTAAIARADHPLEALRSTFGFTRYVRCSRCNAGGPWHLSPKAELTVMSLLLGGPGRSEGHLQVARIGLFDGTTIRFPTEGEAHLRALIRQSPDDPFLRDRLGNLLVHAGRSDLALEAFGEALAIDPSFLPSLFTTGDLFFHHGRDDEAAEAFHALLLAAGSASDIRLDERRTFVRSAIEHLLDLHERSDGRISPLPSAPPGGVEPAGDASEPATVFVTSFDLSREKDWRRLVELFVNPPRRRAGTRQLQRDRVTGRCPSAG